MTSDQFIRILLQILGAMITWFTIWGRSSWPLISWAQDRQELWGSRWRSRCTDINRRAPHLSTTACSANDTVNVVSSLKGCIMVSPQVRIRAMSSPISEHGFSVYWRSATTTPPRLLALDQSPARVSSTSCWESYWKLPVSVKKLSISAWKSYSVSPKIRPSNKVRYSEDVAITVA